MSSLPVFVGIDYHQDSVQVCVLDTDGQRLANRSVGNDAGAVARVVRQHGHPVRVAIEACCGAADMAEELATSEGLPVELAHPGYVARLKRSPDKTDLGDAQLLADLARVNYLPTVWLAPESTRQLRRLVRHRSQLARRRRDVKLRIRGLLRENRLRCVEAAAWTKAWLGWLQHEAELAPAIAGLSRIIWRSW
jgi:transposase